MSSYVSKARFESPLVCRYFQIFSTGFSSGEREDSKIGEMFFGTTVLAVVCHPARSSIRTAYTALCRRPAVAGRLGEVGADVREGAHRRDSEAYIQGISTRSVDDLVKAMGMSGISKSQVSRLCEEIDARVQVFLDRPTEGDWPYLWIDATYVNVRQAGRIVSSSPSASTAMEGARFWGWISVPPKRRPSGPPFCASWCGVACAG